MDLRGRSCLNNLLEFLENTTEYVDKSSPVDGIYLDFRKAFDKVPHRRMLKIKSSSTRNKWYGLHMDREFIAK
jgi:hypothetical protein